MESLTEFGKALVIIGLTLAVIGVVCLLASRLPWWGRLSGDLVVHRGSWTLYMPLGTCLAISLVVSLVLWLWSRR